MFVPPVRKQVEVWVVSVPVAHLLEYRGIQSVIFGVGLPAQVICTRVGLPWDVLTFDEYSFLCQCLEFRSDVLVHSCYFGSLVPGGYC